MDYRKFYDRTQARHLIKIAFLIGFFLAGIRLENHLYETGNCKHIPVPVNNEWVFSEQPKEGTIIRDHEDKYETLSHDKIDARDIESYKFIILAYKSLIHNRLIQYISLHTFPPESISFLQNKNIWHKSSEEEPGILS
jgi:hypothetical protein